MEAWEHLYTDSDFRFKNHGERLWPTNIPNRRRHASRICMFSIQIQGKMSTPIQKKSPLCHKKSVLSREKLIKATTEPGKVGTEPDKVDTEAATEPGKVDAMSVSQAKNGTEPKKV